MNFPCIHYKERFKVISKKNSSCDKQNLGTLPCLPVEVGREIDIMIGAAYFMYSPKLIFEMGSGLRIYESVFSSPDGSRGVIGGPHPKFTEVENQSSQINWNFKKILDTRLEVSKSYKVIIDLPLLGVKEPKDHLKEMIICPAKSKEQQASLVFDSIEKTGTECAYRCVYCGSCKKWKKNKKIEHIDSRRS